MMKEGMISLMASLMGNGPNKDNFYVRARGALQDSLGLYFVTKNIAINNSIEFYLPRLVEMISDLLEVERCSIYLYDKTKDELYLKVITGRLKDPISFKRTGHTFISDCFNNGKKVFSSNA